MRKLIAFTLAMTLFLPLVSCGKTDDFYSEIIAIENSTKIVDYIYLESVGELIGKCKPNLIIRGKVASRADSTVVDYSGKYAADYLDSDASEQAKIACAAEYLVTPYTIEVSENFLGEDVGSLTLNMPYGIYGKYQRRETKYPVLEVGKEYVFFLREDRIGRRMSDDLVAIWKAYFLAFPPASAVEVKRGRLVLAENSVEELIFGGFGSYKKLAGYLGEYIRENNPDTSADSYMLK